MNNERFTGEKRALATRISYKDFHKPMREKFGDKYSNYREQWDKSERGEYLPPFPIQIDFEIIDFCNLKCTMCPRFMNRGSNVSLTLADYRKVIDEGAQKGLKSIGFGNGDEPLLNKDVLQMINYAQEKGIMDIRMITNGTLLNQEISRELLKSGLTFLSVSIDAVNPTTYFNLRGANLLKKVEKNVMDLIDLRNASGENLPVIRVTFVAQPENINELDEFIDKWFKLVDFIDVQDFLDYSKSTNDKQDRFSCFQPSQRVSITAKGDINPCCTFWGREIIIGNIKINTIEDVWTSPQIGELRKRIVDNDPLNPCRTCFNSMRKLSSL